MKINKLLIVTCCFVSGLSSEIYGMDDKIKAEDSICYQERVKKENIGLTKFEILKESAEQGHGPSQYQIGFCYSFGEGIKQDDEEATKWFRKAAEQEVKDAEKVLYISEKILVENEKERLYNLKEKTKE